MARTKSVDAPTGKRWTAFRGGRAHLQKWFKAKGIAALSLGQIADPNCRHADQGFDGPKHRQTLTLAENPLLKILIPTLVILSLGVVAVIRMGSLSEDYRSFDSDARLNLLALTLAATQTAGTGDAEVSSLSAQAYLDRILPEGATKYGRRFYIMDQTGLALATSPNGHPAKGQAATLPETGANLSALDPLLLIDAGAAARVITLANTTEVLVSKKGLRSTPDWFLVGLQPKDAALASWYRQRTQDVLIFIAMTLLSLVLVYSFFAQSARARVADMNYATAYERQETALHHGRSGLWDWELDSGRLIWSSSMASLLGYPQRAQPRDMQFNTEDLAELIHSDDADLVTIRRQLLTTEDTQFDMQMRLRHLERGWIWLRLRGEILTETNGRRRLVGIANDITEQRRMEEQTRLADIRLRDAIEATSEAFVLWDSQNRLVMCNSKYQQLHQLTPDDTRPGTSYSDLAERSHPDIISSSPVRGDIAATGARTYEAALSDHRWLQISERRTKDGGFVSVGTDITQLKRHEEQLMENERRLTATVRDLSNTRQKLETQARQLAELAEKYADEKEKAEAASDAKSEFLANISHELRTPLNAIIGFSEIMRSGVFGQLGSEKYLEYCNDIHQSGNFLLDVINDVLQMSRIEAGRLDLTFAPVVVNDLVKECLRVVDLDVQAKSLTLEVADDPVIALDADRRALKQILINLLMNSVKFTPDEGHITVGLSTADGYLTIEISDTGIGIPEAELKKLGRPFEQVQNQFTKDHKGSGLGLAITKSLTEMHGGVLDINSHQGRGTSVLVTLPLSQQEPQRRAG